MEAAREEKGVAGPRAAVRVVEERPAAHLARAALQTVLRDQPKLGELSKPPPPTNYCVDCAPQPASRHRFTMFIDHNLHLLPVPKVKRLQRSYAACPTTRSMK
jgi:hypothetical protein